MNAKINLVECPTNNLMDVVINPTPKLNGEIYIPGSKSYSHRAFIIASFAEGVSIVKNPLISGDVSVTIDILKSLGVNILPLSDNKVVIKRDQSSYKSIEKVIDCKNSGTSIRIFSALALLVKGGLSFTGEFLKRKRPIAELLNALNYVGGEYEFSENLLKIQRTSSKCDKISIKGDISSQFITALLIMATKLSCGEQKYVEIEITTPLVSYPYIQITLDALRSFGITVFERLDDKRIGTYSVPCNQQIRPRVYEVPGDFSSAAFVIAATALTTEESLVVIRNMDYARSQGDKRIIELLREMGAHIEVDIDKKQVIVIGNRNKYPLHGIKIDCLETPDLFPILSVVGAIAEGNTELYNLSHIRKKESDRVAVMARELTKMGVKIEEESNKMIVYHCNTLKASEIDHEDDHRIAMACFVAAMHADSPSLIKRADIVGDSYPNFIEHFQNLGTNINLYHVDEI
ncbi:MAG: 3-phosphoshikimate 1-carboxyvinyltransferase [Candidatus Lokiarchaeota archaeon]|nr:3-phosphoshikimate 1-carboxyvinyltransferase [Candidatus Lokiarchaeota archaeon]